MNKEEILAKSKRENLWEDERTKQVKNKAENYAESIGTLILVLVTLWKMYHKMPYNDLMAIIGIEIAIASLYKYKNKTENKLYLVTGVMMLFASIIFLLDFFINGVG
ncbi:DUF6442 family protein [Clostridium estertheticum]|uniref:Uncharacterized protein n=1 Tax=Clostridium estertheticum TaxID=238834 RepID=A0A5N7J799_9CLOT|nr:DUF6442 family protein [Clostridium estertheticum]MBU3075425.1 hypothetical protein [Clostridium estertheticum]MBU3165556.1 hypothetical protein [Clostridium estertheticum]MCB2307345.1 DUF6442 family protein [Clostridium estertheticum]MCB2343083.1 DUF6442 family protein [Clostridium estertheticum]MCB2344995.1 DUF6442 family protein [Clostridium estertheticum]